MAAPLREISGIPEVDKMRFFTVTEASVKMKPAQLELVFTLQKLLNQKDETNE